METETACKKVDELLHLWWWFFTSFFLLNKKTSPVVSFLGYPGSPENGFMEGSEAILNIAKFFRWVGKNHQPVNEFCRDPGSPNLRMVSWNLNTLFWGVDYTLQSSSDVRWLDPYKVMRSGRVLAHLVWKDMTSKKELPSATFMSPLIYTPIGSMGLVYLPTNSKFTIKINRSL